jgi:hypothetical protein
MDRVLSPALQKLLFSNLRAYLIVPVQNPVQPFFAFHDTHVFDSNKPVVLWNIAQLDLSDASP